jgi:hypothetical protein
MASFVRLSILGQMPGGEVWSVNPCFFLLDEPASVSAAEIALIATNADAVVVPTGLRAAMNTATLFTGIRAEARNREGVLEVQSEHTKTTVVPGTGSQSHPYQTSSVTSLRSDFPGASGRGRMYWPATGVPVSAVNLRIDPSFAGTMLTGVRTYLTALEAVVAAQAGPCNLSVYSRKGTAFHKIVRILQGDVLDTQRRRRDALAESYSTLTYPT